MIGILVENRSVQPLKGEQTLYLFVSIFWTKYYTRIHYELTVAHKQVYDQSMYKLWLPLFCWHTCEYSLYRNIFKNRQALDEKIKPLS